jgi:hypothetical protein
LDPTESVELSDAQSRGLAAKVREELARRRISRQRLADEAKISLSTLEKALNGSRPFTLDNHPAGRSAASQIIFHRGPARDRSRTGARGIGGL